MVFNLTFPLNNQWWDDGDIQIPNGWNLARSKVENSWGDGEPWNDFMEPEGRHLNRDFLPPHEHGIYLNEHGTSYKLFSGNRSFRVSFLRNFNLESGTYKFNIEFYADYYSWDSGKVLPNDPQSGHCWLRIGNTEKNFDTLNLLGNNVLSHEFEVEVGTHTVEYGFMGVWAISNNGVFIKSVSLEKVAGSTQPLIVQPPTPNKPMYKVIYNLLPQNMPLDKVLQVARETYSKKETIGFSADDAARLVLGGTPESRVVAWNPNQIGTGLTQQWFDDNYAGVIMRSRWIS